MIILECGNDESCVLAKMKKFSFSQIFARIQKVIPSISESKNIVHVAKKRSLTREPQLTSGGKLKNILTPSRLFYLQYKTCATKAET